MKKKISILVVTLLSCFEARTQCIFPIPSNAVVVDSTVTVNGGFDPIWVCKGDTFFSGGGFHNVYLEPGAVMNTGGGIDTIFVKNTATLIMSGGIHYVYYENNNDLQIAGGIPTLDSCPVIFYNYVNAPVNGCFPYPAAAFYASDTNFCENKCIDFFDLSYNNPNSWQWYFPGATPDTSSVQHPANICYTGAGSYDVVLVACNASGCDSIYLTGFIHEFQNPPAPVITPSGDTLLSSTAYSYQWIDTLNPSVILSADSFFIPSQAGYYQVIACDSSGCCTPSSVIHIIGVGMSPPAMVKGLHVSVQPNPNTGFFGINSNTNQTGEISVSIFNLLGEKIYQVTEELQGTEFSGQVDLSGQPAGIYMVEVSHAHNKHYLKVSVTK